MYHTHYSVIVVQINDVCWWCFGQSSRLLQIWKAPFSPQLVWMTTFTLIFFANQFFCTVLVLLFSFSLSCCLTFCNILMTTGFPMSTVKRNECVQFRTFVVRSIQYNSVICWNEFKKKIISFFYSMLSVGEVWMKFVLEFGTDYLLNSFNWIKIRLIRIESSCLQVNSIPLPGEQQKAWKAHHHETQYDCLFSLHAAVSSLSAV